MERIMYKQLIHFPIAAIICAILLFTACASVKNQYAETDPIMGEWTNDKGIAVTIHRLPSKELVAEVVSAPGFFSNDLGAGKMIIRNIQPYMAARYVGSFTMPGSEKSVKLQIRFKDMNTLVFSTTDKRAQGNLMVWKRIVNSKPDISK
jgi:uncharacterized protein (DUF2147 family)